LKISLNVKHVGKEIIVAACDEELLGKTLEAGKIKIEISKKFYGGEIVSVEEAIEALKNCTIGNIIGNNIIEKSIEAGIVHEACLLWIQGIPHAQIVKV